MPYCAILSCFNGQHTQKERGSSLSLHHFPVKNPDLCELWLKNCKKTLNINTARICSDHFLSTDFEDDIRNQVLGKPQRLILKKNVFPTVFASGSQNSDVNTCNVNPTDIDNTNHMSKKDRKLLVDAIILADEEQSACSFNEAESVDFQKLYIRANEKLKKCANESIKKDEMIRIQREIIIKQREELAQLKSLNQRSKTILKGKSSSKSQRVSMVNKIKQVKKFQRRCWTTEEIVRALTVRCVSMKAYESTISSFNLNLPAPRTLRNWVRKFDCKPGLLEDVLSILSDSFKGMNPVSRLGVLSFDEMALDSRFLLDPTFGKVLSHSKVQVVMIRGLYADWKQPIFYNFDTKMTKDLLNTIITRLENIGVIVCAAVSDLGPENQALWREFNIKEGNVRFPNPVDTSRHVHVFADVPHDLKNMRNNTIDKGIVLNDGTLIDKEKLKKMAEKNVDLQIHPKFTSRSLEIANADRMRVQPAAEFFSKKMSRLAQEVFPESPSVSYYFKTMNDGFDVFNSRLKDDSTNKIKCGFGTYEEDQKQALIKMRTMLMSAKFRNNPRKSKVTGQTPENIKVNSRKGKASNKNRTPSEPTLKKVLLPSQLGFCLAVDSLLLLFEELQKLYGVTYILTSRLTQDCLESFFSVIRSLCGSNTHPTPSEFRYRLRLILLGSKTRAPVQPNTSSDDQCFSYLSSELIRRNQMQNLVLKVEERVIDNENPEAQEFQEPSDLKVENLRQLSEFLKLKLVKTGEIPNQPLVDASSTLNENIFEQVKIMDSDFTRLFTTYSKYDHTADLIEKQIKKSHPTFPQEVVKEFLRLRIRMKVKTLNDARQANKSSRRNTAKAKQFSKSTAAAAVKAKSNL